MKTGFIRSIGPNFLYFHKPINQSVKVVKNLKWVDERLKKGLAIKPTRDPMDIAIQQVQNMQTFAQSNLTSLETRQDKLKTTRLEWHKKFTTSLAILVMFLIGAPLGAIIKKGGFGIPVVVAVSFFILMYILTQQGDKMAKEGKVLVEIGAWISNGILSIIGMYFLKIALNDSRLFESDFYLVLWERFKTWKNRRQKYSS
jgi:lipopolysaccharide export system permease protein